MASRVTLRRTGLPRGLNGEMFSTSGRKKCAVSLRYAEVVPPRGRLPGDTAWCGDGCHEVARFATHGVASAVSGIFLLKAFLV
jgi:hypothetical protein